MSHCRRRALLAALVLLPGGWSAGRLYLPPGCHNTPQRRCPLRSFLHRWGERGAACKLRRRTTAAPPPHHRHTTAAVREAGCQSRFTNYLTTYPGVGHDARPGLFDRLLAQRRSAALGNQRGP